MINFRSWRFVFLGTSAVSRSLSGPQRSAKYLWINDTLRSINSLACKAASSSVTHSSCRFFSKEPQAVELTENTAGTDESEDSFFRDVDYEAITNNDPALMKSLKIIMAEIYVMYDEGKEIPSKLTTDNYKELLKTRSYSNRRNYLRHLYLKERLKENEKQKKLAKRAAFEEFKASQEGTDENSGEKLLYGLAENSLFLRVYDTSIDRYNNFTLHLASMYAPKIVIDCSHDSLMSHREAKLSVQQLTWGFGEHRKHLSPAHFVFCNYNKEDKMSQKLHASVPNMYDVEYPFEYHSESYLDLFPKEKLVYLTPHCRNELTTINYDDIYIIGAMVDINTHEKASLSTAKEQGLRMAKFPIDQYLLWGSGTKNLTINQCMMIMADMYWKNDWKFAFERWIPKRKLMKNDQAAFVAKHRKFVRESDEGPYDFPRERFMKKRKSNSHYSNDFYNFRNDSPRGDSALDSRGKLAPRTRR